MIGILIVEDERIVAMALERALRRMRYSVVGITDSAERALEKIAQSPPDLVLMDIGLRGDMDGIQAAVQIHEQFDVPIVFLTAYADEETLQRAKVADAYGYVLKPFEERDLRVAIEMALYKHATEESLRERDRWLAATLNEVSESVIGIDLQNQVQYLNAAAENLTGWRMADALGKPVADVAPFSDAGGQEALTRVVARARRDGEVTSLVHGSLRHRSDRRIPASLSVVPIYDDKGRATGSVMLLQDASEREQAEEAQREVDQRYNLLLHGVSDAVMLLDADGAITQCNQAMAALLGLPQEALIGKAFFDMAALPRGRRKMHRQLFERLRAGETIPPFPMRLEDGKGGEVQLAMTALGTGERVQAFQVVARLLSEDPG